MKAKIKNNDCDSTIKTSKTIEKHEATTTVCMYVCMYVGDIIANCYFTIKYNLIKEIKYLFLLHS